MRRTLLAACMALCAAPAAAQFPAMRTPGGDPLNMSVEDGRVLTGNGFTVSTAIVAVASGNYLYASLANTSASRSLVLTDRVLSCNTASGATPNEYLRYASGTALPGTPTSVTVGNRIAGGAAIPATFAYGMSATLPTGTVTSGGMVPTNGIEKRIEAVVIVPPGGSLVYSIGGSGGGLAAATRCVMTFLGYVAP